ncbi:MAG: SpoIIE family protein phosphatase [Flavobacteriales bacterium]|nr:SpoIIE family protein phosphatase [Flavobacteriales bacterium]
MLRHTYTRFLIAGCFSLFIHRGVKAQDLKFSRVEGLSQSVVNCILQDSKGFMWFGTQTGLNLYDGYSFTIFKNNPLDSNSMSHSYVQCLLEGSDGSIWVGTDGGGLNRYNRLTNTFSSYKHDPKDFYSLSGDQIKALLQTKDGTLWVGTENGLCAMNISTGKCIRYQKDDKDRNSISYNKVSCLAQDAKGIIWIGTENGGLNSFNPSTGKFAHYFNNADEHSGIGSNWVTAILPDSEGKLWVGSFDKGLTVFNPSTGKSEYFTDSSQVSICHTRVTDIKELSDGNVWITTYNGISVYNRKTGKFKCIRPDSDYEYSLSSPQIRCLLEDDAGTVWVGTYGGGVNAYFKGRQKFRYYRQETNVPTTLSSNTIMCFAEVDDATVWIGTVEGGISVWNRKLDEFSHIEKDGPEGLTHQSVISLLKDSRGKIWAGTWGRGLQAYDPATGKFTHYRKANPGTRPGGLYVSNQTVLSLAEDPKGKIWAGTFAGINIYDPKTESFSYLTMDEGLSDNVIYSLYAASNDVMWIGTLNGGLDAYDLHTGEFTHYQKQKDNTGISDNAIYSIYEDEKGFIWLGTGNGLCKLNPATGRFENYYEANGLPSNVILGIVPDDKGNLWLSTSDKGIARFTPAAGREKIEVRSYDVDDGLQNNEFNQGAYCKLASGEILFGGIKGFNAFLPSDVRENNHVPPVYIKSFRTLGQELKLDTNIIDKKYIELDYKDAVFLSFEVVGLDYIRPAKNQYKFKMEGLEDNWRPAGQNRFPQYTNLKGGHYVFRVMASNSDDLWNQHETTLSIYVVPPFWETEWFLTLCTIVVVAGVFGFIRWRTQQIQRENKVLEGKVAERTRELAQKNEDITSSIMYAQRIQQAILPSKDTVCKQLKAAFILYLPKDIVSGDFYWYGQRDGLHIIAAVDCTGHGVPGAFMSMIGTNLLNQIVLEQGVTRPSEILNKLNDGVQRALQQGHHEVETTDGMDVALCSFDPQKMEIQFAGAYRPLFIFNASGFEMKSGNKFPIGGVQVNEARVFTNHKIKVEPGDRIYLFSDGYVDQFGGELGKKFMTKRFRQLLLHLDKLPMPEQAKLLREKFEEWRGKEEQVDDVLVIGIRF